MQKKWFISGASRGIGYTLTEQVLAQGDAVYATYRDPGDLLSLVKRYPDRLYLAHMDVCQPQEMQTVVTSCLERWGGIDILVSNAGYGLFGAVEECTDDQMCRLVETNVYGSVRLIKAFLPSMRQASRGHILQLSSLAGLYGFGGSAFYCMTKFAMEGFCDALSQEVSSFGIKVTLIEPGGVYTDFFTLGKSAEAAEPIDAYRHPDQTVGRLFKDLEEDDVLPLSMPDKVARQMILVTFMNHPPLRLALGSDAYRIAHAALSERLRTLEDNYSTTIATDRKNV